MVNASFAKVHTAPKIAQVTQSFGSKQLQFNPPADRNTSNLKLISHFCITTRHQAQQQINHQNMVKQKLVFQNPNNNSNNKNNTKAKAQKKKTQSTKQQQQQQQQQQTNEKIDEATTTTTPELITTTTTTSPTIEVTMTLVDDDHHSDEDMSATSPTPTSTTTTIQQDVDSDNIDDTIATSVMSEQSVLKQLNQLKKKLKKYSRLEQEG